MSKPDQLTTQAAVIEALRKELDGRTEEILQPIQTIKARLAEIDKAQGRINAEIEGLQQDLEKAKAESGAALLKGASPLPAARRVRELENDIAALQAMPDINAEERQTLVAELAEEVNSASKKLRQLTATSQTRLSAQAALDAAYEQAVAVHKSWDQGEITFLRSLGVPAQVVKLGFQPSNWPDVSYLKDKVNEAVVGDRWRASVNNASK